MGIRKHRLDKSHVSATVTGEGTGSIKAGYAAQWKVWVDNPLVDTPMAVLHYFRANPTLPWIGQPFRYGSIVDTSVFCDNIDPQYVENSDGLYVVKATWQPLKSEDKDDQTDEDGNKTDDPLKWAGTVDTSYTQTTVPAYSAVYIKGMKGRADQIRKKNTSGPICNSVQQPFDPTLEDEVNIAVIRFSKNVPSCKRFEYDWLQGAVNTNKVTINKPKMKFRDEWKPYTALVKNIGYRLEVQDGVPYYQRTIEVWVNPLGWREEVLDHGLEVRAMEGDPDGKGGTISASDIKPGMPLIRKATDKNGNPMASPVNLNGDGQPLKEGEAPVYLTYAIKREVKFPENIWW